jgi:hypothetical protein
MNFYTRTYHENEQELPVSSQRTFPPAPYPRNYVHCVFEDLYEVVQAVHALRADGHNAGDIHVMSRWDYIEAVEHKRQQQCCLSKMLTRFLNFLDVGFGEVYLYEALRGSHLLMVRLSGRQQVERVGDILMSHLARRIIYVDAWTVTYLSPPHEERGSWVRCNLLYRSLWSLSVPD